MGDTLRSFDDVTFEEVVGRDWSFTLVLEDGGGNPIDLTGYTVTAIVKSSFDGTATEPFTLSLGNGFSIPTPANGEIVFKKRIPNDTIGLFEYDITIEDADGVKLSYLRGQLRILGGL